MSIPERAPQRPIRTAQRGVGLIELIVFIVVVGIAVAGVLVAYQQSTRAAVDPMIQKQALAVAESLMEEIMLLPHSWCDPNDPQANIVASQAACTIPEAIGPEAGETRTGANPFDNVNDYHGFAMNPISDVTGVVTPGLAGYTASVSVAQSGADFAGVPAGDVLIVTVTVTGPGGANVALQGYRLRYAPLATL